MKLEEALLLLNNVFAMLDVVLILKFLYGLDLKIKWKSLGISATIYYIFGLIIAYEEIREKVPSGTLTYFMTGMLLLVTLILSEKHRILNLLMVIPSILIYMQWVQMVAMIEKLIGLDNYYIYIQKDKITPLYFFQDISLFMILFYMERKGIKEEYNIRLSLGESIFTTIFCLFFPLFTSVLDNIDQKINDPYFSSCWVIFVLAVNMAVVYAIAHRKKARYYRELSNYQKKQFGEEYDYFTKYKNSNKEIAKFRHDWNNHMLVMQSMLQAGEYEKMEDYFKKLSNTSETVMKKIITGNDMVDTIFAIKEPLFTKYDIHVDYDGNLSQFLLMESVDVSILFSNLIDNAIESCSQCKGERYFHIRITESPHNWMIVLENSTNSKDFMYIEKMQELKLPLTTKKDKRHHGLGLQNVNDIVKKYQGEIELVKKMNIFAVKMIFPKD